MKSQNLAVKEKIVNRRAAEIFVRVEKLLPEAIVYWETPPKRGLRLHRSVLAAKSRIRKMDTFRVYFNDCADDQRPQKIAMDIADAFAFYTSTVNPPAVSASRL
jgi:hypothetical protein